MVMLMPISKEDFTIRDLQLLFNGNLLQQGSGTARFVFSSSVSECPGSWLLP